MTVTHDKGANSDRLRLFGHIGISGRIGACGVLDCDCLTGSPILVPALPPGYQVLRYSSGVIAWG